jgi:molecular chaperone Hsp33
MRKRDILFRGTACSRQFRFFAVDSTCVVQTAVDLHKMAPAPTLLLGRLLTAALLMGIDLKNESSALTLNIEADGPLKGAISIYDPVGKVRGYAKNPDYFASEVSDNWHIGKLLGTGKLSIIKDFKLKSPVISTIELVTGEIAEDIAHYYLNSEQIPTAVSLGVLFDKDGKINAAGGYLIQQMPDAIPSDVQKLISNLDQTPYITDLLDMGLDWNHILGKIIFKDMEWSIASEQLVKYYCPCNKERFADALRMLKKEELETMGQGISPVCHYCNRQYDFTADDIQNIIRSL